ncbi:MAG TPA: DUF4199 domain-containing protein [Chitinophagales bacterium]|nr:DUF4199 domain-containing protein [Chitinophagales bacterium]
MRKTILTYGLISGAISAIMMFATVSIAHKIGYEKGEIIGYTTIILSFTLVFFGIKSYRDRIGDGSITFGKAFTIGLLIAIISSACYVISWLIVYYNFYPDFMQQYATHTIEKMQASGASQEAIAATAKKMEQYKEWYKNPLIIAAMTFTEPFPVGLLVAIISALILRRKPSTESAPV